ncbi:siderophore-interacting protein [Nocardia sp. NPDC052316]|uniref:siderophore-interacting protein n=1 Tax=Nocardia sp. NPDC052316 TaxID=3364329 RepID=UPI0037C5AC80
MRENDMRENLANPRRGSARKPLEYLFAKYKAQGTITHVESVTPTMKSIRIHSEELGKLPYTPGQHVRIEINDPLSIYGIFRPVETLRSYTIWDYAPTAKTFELRAHLYDGEGIGLTWARDAKPGDEVTYWGPQGDFVTGDAPYHLFIGEETATVAFGAMIRGLDARERVYGLLESESAADELPVPGEHRLHRVYREGAPALSSPTLLSALTTLNLPDTPGAAYIAGEARTCQAVRDHLVRERDWPRDAITVKPFWTPGKRGLH